MFEVLEVFFSLVVGCFSKSFFCGFFPRFLFDKFLAFLALLKSKGHLASAFDASDPWT